MRLLVVRKQKQSFVCEGTKRQAFSPNGVVLCVCFLCALRAHHNARAKVQPGLGVKRFESEEQPEYRTGNNSVGSATTGLFTAMFVQALTDSCVP